jgi:hypothetical protein
MILYDDEVSILVMGAAGYYCGGALFFVDVLLRKSESHRIPIFTTACRSPAQLVAQGQIAPGMSRNAVWLAWGALNKRSTATPGQYH